MSFNIRKNPERFRNMVFGAEDSLVSTVGLLFGIASADTSKFYIVLTGIILIAVEAMSMGAGAYLSETSASEIDKKVSNRGAIVDGIIMFFSYLLAGLIPLTPYLLLDGSLTRYVSAGASLVALFLLGYLPTRQLKSAIRMSVVAGMAVAIGFTVAFVANYYIGQ